MRQVMKALVVLVSTVVLAACAGLTGGAPTGPASDSNSAVPGDTGARTPEPTPSRTFPASSAWAIDPSMEATDAQLAAFTDHSAVTPGTPLGVYISAAGGSAVSVYRLGDYDGSGGLEVVSPMLVATTAQTAVTVDPATRAASAPWQVSTTLPTDDWPPGFYFLHVVSSGKARNVPFVVRSKDLKGKVVFVAGDTTWQAYNSWGGRSLYKGPGGFADRAYAVSFDRPYSANDWQIWFDFDVSVVNALEQSGVEVGYTSVSALAADPGSLAGAAGVVSNGHDEYWPTSYRDALVTARDQGTNVAFLGANAGYWRVRLQDTALGSGRLVVGYKSAALDPVKNSPDTTARWRDAPSALPENTIIGQLYDCFPSRGDVTIVTPDFFLFAGTGVQQGSRIPGLVGNESDRAYADANTPRPIQVPALSQATCKSTTTYSTMTYYTVPSGAGVFSTGTMNWGRSMSGPSAQFGLTQQTTDFTRAVTMNLAKAMAAGPMGASHPAVDDFGVLANLPATNHADGD